MWSVSFGGKCTLFTKLKGGLTAASNQTVTQTLHPAGFSQCWYETTRPTLPLLSKYPSCAFVMSHILSASEGAWDSPSVGLFVTVVQGLEALLFLLLAEAGGVGHFKEGRCELHQPARVDGGHLTHVLLCSQHQLVVHNPIDKEFEKSGSAQLARKIYFLFRCGTVKLKCWHTTQAAGWTEHWRGGCKQLAGLSGFCSPPEDLFWPHSWRNHCRWLSGLAQ